MAHPLDWNIIPMEVDILIGHLATGNIWEVVLEVADQYDADPNEVHAAWMKWHERDFKRLAEVFKTAAANSIPP